MGVEGGTPDAACQPSKDEQASLCRLTVPQQQGAVGGQSTPGRVQQPLLQEELQADANATASTRQHVLCVCRWTAAAGAVSNNPAPLRPPPVLLPHPQTTQPTPGHATLPPQPTPLTDAPGRCAPAWAAASWCRATAAPAPWSRRCCCRCGPSRTPPQRPPPLPTMLPPRPPPPRPPPPPPPPREIGRPRGRSASGSGADPPLPLLPPHPDDWPPPVGGADAAPPSVDGGRRNGSDQLLPTAGAATTPLTRGKGKAHPP